MKRTTNGIGNGTFCEGMMKSLGKNYLLKCSRIRSSRTVSGKFPTQRCRVSRTILQPGAPHWVRCVRHSVFCFRRDSLAHNKLVDTQDAQRTHSLTPLGGALITESSAALHKLLIIHVAYSNSRRCTDTLN